MIVLALRSQQGFQCNPKERELAFAFVPKKPPQGVI